MAIDSAVQGIIDASLAGEGFSQGELMYLFKVKPGSAEHAAMLEARKQIRRELTEARDGRGTMFAQIGVDSQPCLGNCFHCSFAARFETYAAANEVGFKIAASVENVSPQFTNKAIARVFMRMRNEVHPQSCGCTSKRLVKGTAGFDQPDFPDEILSMYQLSLALLMNGVARFIGGGIMYAEAGTNPRDWTMHTEVDGLIKQRGTSLEGFTKELREEGFIIEPGPSRFW